MIIVKALGTGLVLTLAGLALLVVVLVGAITHIAASAGISGIAPSEEAITDIPPAVLDAYLSVGDRCPGLPWTVIAGIGAVESNHGRHGGASLDPDGTISPPIIGIPLDGRPGVALITDTDNGRLDGDTTYDRAVGPFQFIPSTWALYEQAIGAPRDPHRLTHAIDAAVWHLCPTGTVTNLRAAIFSYNGSQSYVDHVLDRSGRYTGTITAGPVVAGYALPLTDITPAMAQRPHHDYPAWDAGVPVGTTTYAITAGHIINADDTQPTYQPGRSRCGNLVIIDGDDDIRYTYCHLSTVTVSAGNRVTAGQPIGTTGGQPGTPGAGNTTGPHLHLGLQHQGRSLCPQQLLASILNQQPINPLTLPTNGCTN